jgi:hypothetical protein
MRRSLVLVSCALVLATLNLPAEASSGETVLYEDSSVTVVQDGEWVEWRFASSLVGSAQHVYRGTRESGGGCRLRYSETVTPAPDGWINVERETASSVADCVMVTESGLAQAEDPTVSDDSAGEATQVFKPTTKGGGGGGGVSIQATATRWFKVSLEDIIQLNVADDKASVSFNYDGNCVTSSWDHIGEWHWLWGSGWHNSSRGGSATRICSYAETDTYSHFYNDVFCGGEPRTWGRFYMVRVRGQENGSQTNASDVTKYGGCSGALHFDYESS